MRTPQFNSLKRFLKWLRRLKLTADPAMTKDETSKYTIVLKVVLHRLLRGVQSLDDVRRLRDQQQRSFTAEVQFNIEQSGCSTAKKHWQTRPLFGVLSPGRPVVAVNRSRTGDRRGRPCGGLRATKGRANSKKRTDVGLIRLAHGSQKTSGEAPHRPTQIKDSRAHPAMDGVME